MTEKMHRKWTSAAKSATVVALLSAPSALMASKPPPAPPPAPAPPPIPAPVKLNNQFFDWYTPADPVSGSTIPQNQLAPAYIDSPRLTDANAAAVNTFLTNLGAGKIRAVKVEHPISNATASLIFNNPNYNVSYIFGDLETGTNTPTDFGNLVKQVRYVNGLVGGTKTRSSLGYVGNFGFSAETSSQEQPANYTDKSKHSFQGWTRQDYDNSGANMSLPGLYPGDPSYRNFAQGDSTATNQSPPNIRTSLFMMPLYRMGKGTDSLQSTGRLGVDVQVPFVANFNNYGNLGLDNGSWNGITHVATATGVRNAGDGYAFIPGTAMAASGTYPAMSSSQTANQMLSGQDFASMIAHIRLRGADSFHTLESGQVGVSNAQMMSQAQEGWLEPHINAIMQDPGHKLLIGFEQIYGQQASGGTYVMVDGTIKNPEQTGVIMDGAYTKSGIMKLDFLLTNMDGISHKITLPSTIGGTSLNTAQLNYTLNAGTHLLVEYTLKGSQWTNAVTSIPFTDLDTNRNRPGVPEPGMLSLLGVAGVFGLTRRRRKTIDAEL